MSISLQPITYRHVIFPELKAGYGPDIGVAPPDRFGPTVDQDESLNSTDYDRLQRLFRLGGLNLDDYRSESIKRRIPACLRALRLESTCQLRGALHRRPQFLQAAISALVIGVTSFFRDPAAFGILGREVLPQLLVRFDGPRVWSVGCSDGAELYSVAMMLDDRNGLRGASLLGTDCRPDAIARAREGSFDPSAVKNVPAEFLGRYLAFDGARWHVHPYLRAAIDWRSGNVLATPEPGRWDLILCRNLAIYLQPGAAARLWSALAHCLRPGGFLMLGKAERPVGACGLRQFAPGIYQREGG